MDDRTARIAVACAVEPGTPGVAEELAESGPHAVLAALAGRAGRSGGRSGAVAGRLSPAEVPAMVAAQAGLGVRVLVPGDAEFPSQLLDLPEPPLALWVRGAADLRVATLRSVAVVGSRACTAYGERATGQIVADLASTGWTVVSGAAFGIDAAAHRAALAAGGTTAAVLACGVDVPYPRAHDSLLCRIADSGALVSELPPGSQPLKHRFLARNRLIAALTRGTVVVEAARRSGAIATANRALELGRAVMAAPGPITAMASSGTNRLLHEQAARAVADGAEVVSVLLEGPSSDHAGGNVGEHPVGDDVRAEGPATPGAETDLPEGARRILAELPRRGGLGVPEVARTAGMGAAECLAQLGLLEVLGHATRGRGGWRRVG